MRWHGLVTFLGLLLLGGQSWQAQPPGIGGPLSKLSQQELERFAQGKKLFERSFTPEDGLGPLYNADGCIACHFEPAAGGGSEAAEVHASRFVSPDSCDPLFRQGGPVVQLRATPLLQAAGFDDEDVFAGATDRALRTTPPIFGLGLVDAIPDKAILSREDPLDKNKDGISGRANRSIDGRLGRFGRKAFIPSLADFNAGAFLLEQGLTTPFLPVEETINGAPVPPDTDPAPDPEISVDQLAAVNDFTRFLAPPAPLSLTGKDKKLAKQGEKIFGKAGCDRCHVPSMRTGGSKVGALANKDVFLYSDLLLHDMGPAASDICLGLARPSEFRTEMLMGLRFRKQFLHDGSAKNVSAAIEAHGGEAFRSREAFLQLEPSDREALLKFLDGI